jgi:hypothetical protein
MINPKLRSFFIDSDSACVLRMSDNLRFDPSGQILDARNANLARLP